MSLSISSTNIADTRVQGVTLRPVLGAYELVFGLYLNVHSSQGSARRASIIGAGVTVKRGGAGSQRLGFARPDSPFEILPRARSSPMSANLILLLQPGQLAAVENLRGTGDLDFELLATGLGVDENGEQQIQDEWRVHIPRSDWIKKLRDAKARDTLLLEVPLPIQKTSKKWADIASGLQSAEEHFRNGDYHTCVASCRAVIQELGYQKFKKKEWSGPLLGRLASNREGMTKEEREAALWGALRHYTHQAHHAKSEGGEWNYVRCEAQLILTLTASFVARAQGR